MNCYLFGVPDYMQTLSAYLSIRSNYFLTATISNHTCGNE